MKRVLLALPLLLAACVARTPEPSVEHTTPDMKVSAPKVAEAPAALVALLPAGHRAGMSVEVNGARIVAILADDATAETPYVVLDEAMKAEVCVIRETGAASAEGEQIEGDVNTLLVTNSGDKPIFLMAGDLVLGGKQDRVLAESVVVDAGVTDMRIPVFCVESGRWQVQGKDGEHADKGTFANEASCGQVDVNVKRQAIATGNQGEVWKQVAMNNSALKVSADSGTFRATYDDEATRKQIEDAYAQAARLVNGKLVGFAVVHDGEVAAMDIFDSTGLAHKVSEKLLRSYIITAIGNGYEVALPQKLARETVSFVCTNIAVTQAAGTLGRLLNVAITIDEEVKGEVTLKLESTDGVAAITALAEQVKAVAVVQESSLLLMPRTEYEQRTIEFTQNDNRQRVQTESIRTAGNDELERRSDEPAPPSESAPNDRTANSREYKKDAVNYSCEDKKTGRKVQSSYMRR
ncbi:MAG: hypothetical protein IT464_03035 [Planctomycetes bacterium]|nr:hypothetical protein [Planctomycetota bacterium]